MSPPPSSSSASSNLDPLAAASLVCNVLQLAGHAINAILLLRQIRAEHAPDQSVQRHAQAVHTLAAKVVRGLKRNDDGSRALSEDDERVLDVATECQQAARELGELLADAPRVQRGGLRAWRVVAWVVRKRGRLEVLEGRMERAGGLLAISSVMDVVNSIDVAKLSTAHQTIIKRIQDGRTDIMDIVFQDGAHTRQVTFETDLTRAQLESVANARRLVVATRMESGQTLTSILVKRDPLGLKEDKAEKEQPQPTESRPSSQGDTVKNHEQSQRPQSRLSRQEPIALDPGQEREIILASLAFPEQDAPRGAVGAFDWLWEDVATKEHVAWGAFTRWLKGDTPSLSCTDSLFWITGKAGSGKSTLVQSIVSHPSTLTLLHKTDDEEPLLAAHFFWRPGAQLQKSYRGFLCSLLLQLVTHDVLALTPVLGVLLRLDPAAPKNKRSPLDWTVDELERCCREALSSRAKRGTPTQPSSTILIMADGVDEVDQDNGDFDDLADFIDEISRIPGVRVCVSARPEPVFHDWLGGCRRLNVVDLTAYEIETFARAHLCLPTASSTTTRAATPNRHSWQQQRELDRLCRQLCDRAEGVFLWMRFAVGWVNRGVRNGDEPVEVEARVRAFPGKLAGLYRFMLDTTTTTPTMSTSAMSTSNTIDGRARQRAALYFLAVVRAHDPSMYWLFNHPRHTDVDVLDVVFMARPDLAMSVLAADGPSRGLAGLIADECDELEGDIETQCAGMLECRRFERDLWEWEQSVRSTTYYGVHNAKIVLVHHTAYDFFTQTKEGAEILARAGLTDTEARIRLATAYLAACRTAYWITRAPFDVLRFLAWLKELDVATPGLLSEGERLLRIGEMLYAEGALGVVRSGRLAYFRGHRKVPYLSLALDRGLDHFVAATFGARLVSDDDKMDVFTTACRIGFQSNSRLAPDFVRWMLRRDGGGVNPNALEGDRLGVPVDQLPPRSAFSAYLSHASCAKPLSHEWVGYSSWARRVVLDTAAFIKSGANLGTHVPLLLSLDGGVLGFVHDEADAPVWDVMHAPVMCYIVEAAVLVRDVLLPTAEAILAAEQEAEDHANIYSVITEITTALYPFSDRRNCGYVYQFLDEHPRVMASFGHWSARPVSHDASVILAEALLALFCTGGLALAKSTGEVCWNTYLQSGPVMRRVRHESNGGRVVWETVVVEEVGPSATWRWIVGSGEDGEILRRVEGRMAVAEEAIRGRREAGNSKEVKVTKEVREESENESENESDSGSEEGVEIHQHAQHQHAQHQHAQQQHQHQRQNEQQPRPQSQMRTRSQHSQTPPRTPPPRLPTRSKTAPVATPKTSQSQTQTPRAVATPKARMQMPRVAQTPKTTREIVSTPKASQVPGTVVTAPTPTPKTNQTPRTVVSTPKTPKTGAGGQMSVQEKTHALVQAQNQSQTRPHPQLHAQAQYQSQGQAQMGTHTRHTHVQGEGGQRSMSQPPKAQTQRVQRTDVERPRSFALVQGQTLSLAEAQEQAQSEAQEQGGVQKQGAVQRQPNSHHSQAQTQPPPRKTQEDDDDGDSDDDDDDDDDVVDDIGETSETVVQSDDDGSGVLIYSVVGRHVPARHFHGINHDESGISGHGHRVSDGSLGHARGSNVGQARDRDSDVISPVHARHMVGIPTADGSDEANPIDSDNDDNDNDGNGNNNSNGNTHSNTHDLVSDLLIDTTDTPKPVDKPFDLNEDLIDLLL